MARSRLVIGRSRRDIDVLTGTTTEKTDVALHLGGHEPDELNLSATDDVVATIHDIITSSLKYISESMDTGFLMTSLVLAFITAALAIFAFKFLGKDDLKALGVIEEKEEEHNPSEWLLLTAKEAAPCHPRPPLSSHFVVGKRSKMQANQKENLETEQVYREGKVYYRCTDCWPTENSVGCREE